MNKVAAMLALSLSACGAQSVPAQSASDVRVEGAQAVVPGSASGSLSTMAVGSSQPVAVPAPPAVDLTIVEAGVYCIDVVAQGRDAIAVLLRGDEIVARDDDGGDDTNARIEQMLTPGAYRLAILEYGGRAMNANVTVTRLPDPPVVATLSGLGSATVATRAGASPTLAAVDVLLNIGVSGFFEINATPIGEADPKIELWSSAGLIAADDDGGGGTASRLEVQLNPGSYRVRVMAYDNSAINVRLSVEPGRAH